MTLRETLLGSAAKGSDPDELARVAHTKVQANRDKLTAAQAREAQLNSDLATIETEIEAAASLAAEGGDRKQYDAKVERRAQLRDELALIQAARRAHLKEQRDAEAALHKARLADQLKTGRRHVNSRTRHAAKLTEGVALVLEGWGGLHADADKIRLWGGSELAGAGGVAILRSEIEHLVGRELARVSAPQALDGKATPALPGSRAGALDGDPRKFKSLVEAITEANEYLLKRIEEGPTPREDTATTEQPAPDVQSMPADGPGVKFDAAQVLATLQPRTLKS